MTAPTRAALAIAAEAIAFVTDFDEAYCEKIARRVIAELEAAALLLREPQPTDEAVAKALGCMWGVGIDESLEIFVSPRYVVEAVRSAALEVR